MTSNVINIENYTPNSSDQFLVDANVWISRYEPAPKDEIFQEKYENFFQKIKASSAEVIVSSLVVSEFINRLIRLDFELYSGSSGIIVGKVLNFHKRTK